MRPSTDPLSPAPQPIEERCGNCGHNKYFHLEWGCVERLREPRNGESFLTVACGCKAYLLPRTSEDSEGPNKQYVYSEEAKAFVWRMPASTVLYQPSGPPIAAPAASTDESGEDFRNPVWAAGYRAARLAIGQKLQSEGSYLIRDAVVSWLLSKNDNKFLAQLRGNQNGKVQ